MHLCEDLVQNGTGKSSYPAHFKPPTVVTLEIRGCWVLDTVFGNPPGEQGSVSPTTDLIDMYLGILET